MVQVLAVGMRDEVFVKGESAGYLKGFAYGIERRRRVGMMSFAATRRGHAQSGRGRMLEWRNGEAAGRRRMEMARMGSFSQRPALPLTLRRPRSLSRTRTALASPEHGERSWSIGRARADRMCAYWWTTRLGPDDWH